MPNQAKAPKPPSMQAWEAAVVTAQLAALLLSLLPVGLSVAWFLFDDDHLCWHDRLSKTYLRKG
jgi:hypothetical protein